jgi:hypothetical protein
MMIEHLVFWSERDRDRQRDGAHGARLWLALAGFGALSRAGLRRQVVRNCPLRAWRNW